MNVSSQDLSQYFVVFWLVTRSSAMWFIALCLTTISISSPALSNAEPLAHSVDVATSDDLVESTGVASAQPTLSVSSQGSATRGETQRDEVRPPFFTESDLILSDGARWRSAGFRLGLGYYQSVMRGLGSTPSGEVNGVEIGLSARLDPDWSIDGEVRYGLGGGGLGGLVFSGMLSGAWHWFNLSAALGVGVAGHIEQSESRPDPYPVLMNEVVASYTLPERQPPLAQCVGFGPMTGLKISYHLPISQITAVHIGIRADLARVTCEQDTERVEPDTAQGIVIRQYWTRWSWSWVGGVAWR